MTFPLTPAVPDVRRRGAALGGWLTQLLWVYGLFNILGLVGLVGAVAALLAASALPGAGAPGSTLLIMMVLASGLLGLVSLVLSILAIRAAKQALGSVTGAADDRAPATLDPDVRRLNTWLTLGQWGALAGAVLGVLIGLVSNQAVAALAPEERVPPTFLLAAGLIANVPALVLNWLILASVKRFFSHVSLRARGARQPVGPAAGKAASWLMFVYVVLWIGAVLGVLGLLPAVFLPAILGFGRGADAAVGVGVLAVLVVVFLAFSGWLYSLLLRLVGHSRLFALEVAARLDRPREDEAAPAADPWQGVPAPR